NTKARPARAFVFYRVCSRALIRTSVRHSTPQAESGRPQGARRVSAQRARIHPLAPFAAKAASHGPNYEAAAGASPAGESVCQQGWLLQRPCSDLQVHTSRKTRLIT